MLKKSLLTALILALAVTTAGAEIDIATIKAQPTEQSAFELSFNSLSAGCEANASEALFLTSWMSPAEQLLSSQLDAESTATATSLFGSWGRRWCLMCTSFGCFRVPC